MEKYITDERTGLRYELIGDIYYIAGDDEPEEECEPIGVWGQRHLRFIKENKRSLYLELLMTGKLNSYLSDIDQQAEEMFFQLMGDMTHKEGVTEQLKAKSQIEWLKQMSGIKTHVFDIIDRELFQYKQLKL